MAAGIVEALTPAQSQNLPLGLAGYLADLLSSPLDCPKGLAVLVIADSSVD